MDVEIYFIELRTNKKIKGNSKMKKTINIIIVVAFFIAIAIPVHADVRKFVAKDYDLSNDNEVLTINIKLDGLIGGIPKYYNVMFNNLENGTVMTFLRKIDLTPDARIAVGFNNNRLDRRNNISVASDSHISVHTFRVKRNLLNKDKLALLRLRQFQIDPSDSSKLLFLKEQHVRINLIPDEATDCIATPTCARLDYLDLSIFKEYQTTCIGGGVEVAASSCS